jgi:hypothetical protein
VGHSARAYEDGYPAHRAPCAAVRGGIAGAQASNWQWQAGIPGRKDKNKPISNNTILFALYRLGYQGRMTGHGFRGLASTVLNESGFDEAHVELQLAHMKRNKIAAAYNHAKYLKQRTGMMQWWADYLEGQAAKGRQILAA